MRRGRRCPTRTVLGLLAVWLTSEAVHAIASRALIPPRPAVLARAGPPAVVVLGYHNRDPDLINRVNRWRAESAIRSLPATGAVRVIASGGSRRPGRSEAALLAAYLRRRLGQDAEAVVVEDNSLSTWENIAHVLPLLADASTITLVSNPLHALRARWYLRMQDPVLAGRLVRAGDYRFGEHGWAKPGLTAYGLRDLILAILGLRGREPGAAPRVDATVATSRRQGTRRPV